MPAGALVLYAGRATIACVATMSVTVKYKMSCINRVLRALRRVLNMIRTRPAAEREIRRGTEEECQP